MKSEIQNSFAGNKYKYAILFHRFNKNIEVKKINE